MRVYPVLISAEQMALWLVDKAWAKAAVTLAWAGYRGSPNCRRIGRADSRISGVNCGVS
jgi:hypothetical protein